jgi:hypothetical protein
MMRKTTVLVLVSFLLILGCGQIVTPMPTQQPSPEPTSTSPAPPKEWFIKLKQSGGIMGLLRSIEISSDGTFIVTDQRSNKTTSGDLSADKLLKLNEQVTIPEQSTSDKPNGMVCADCFVYDLEIRKSGKTFSIQLNDINLPSSKYEDLITQLRDLMDTALK